MPTRDNGTVLALSGGIGGAKLALGLSRVLPPERLVVIANTGDDFEHLGLSISPDIDTLMYTLAGLDNPEIGWGRRGETWTFMAAIESIGGPSWFRLGDGDLAVHVERTRRLAAGETLSAITGDLCQRLKVGPRVVPMSNDHVRTRVKTALGWLEFQDYFVRQRCEPRVLELSFAGASDARLQPEISRLLGAHGLRAVVICPSNPFISIDPMLAVPGMRAALAGCKAPVVAVSPIVGGRAVKGPTAKMMAELGLEVSAAAVARHYGDLIDGYIADHMDTSRLAGLDVAVTITNTMMISLEDRIALARKTLEAADTLGRATVAAE